MRNLPPSHRTRAIALAATLVGALAASLAGVVPAGSGPAASAQAPIALQSASSVQTTPATSFRLATFNVLGHDHTEPGGNRKGWDSGTVRIERVVNLLNEEAIDVVGFQEFQPPQAVRFAELTGTAWQTFPGVDPAAGAPSVNSIAWRTDTWTRIQAATLPVPYFDGVPSNMPYVLLQNNHTGRQVWFFNTHNPADTRGNAQALRDQGFAMEAALANQLRAAYPDAPFVSFGDKNESSRYYCAVAPTANLRSASGGYVDGTTCSAPKSSAIDWIMGTPDVFFNTYVRRQDAYVKATSDHPMYHANAVIAASVPTAIDHVVVVAVPGLTASVVGDLGTRAKHLTTLAQTGASTTNARTVKERISPDANLMSVLTGRRVAPGAGGHGIDYKRTNPATVRQAAGEYVSSIFDLAHNNSLHTAMVGSRPELALVRQSWNREAGGRDPYGIDNGTAKIDRQAVLPNDFEAVRWWRQLVPAGAPNLSVIELSDLVRSSAKHGYTGEAYEKAVLKLDNKLGQIARVVRYDPGLRGRTLFVVVGTQGAVRPTKSNAWLQSYRVPLYVTGPGVPVATDLYALNPAYLSPALAQPGYGGTPPIRTGDVANLTMRALRLPPIPGSTMNTTQLFQVFDPTALPATVVPTP